MKGKILAALLILAMVIVSACGNKSETNSSENANNENSNDNVYTLKLGTALTPTDPIYQGLEAFKDAVEEKTGGDVKIEIYGSGSLGEDKDIVEQAIMGANVGVIVDTGRLAEMVPEIGILSAPYIVDSYEEAREVVMSDLFKGWEEKLVTDFNVEILSFNWYQGDRHILTNKPINTPDDLKGLKLRTPGAAIWTETITALGASPAGMPWTEVYPGVQQGVIDGAEAQHPATYGAKLYEVISNISKTSHFQLLTGLVVGSQWLETLPAEYQEILKEEALIAGDEASKNTVDMLDEFEADMVAEGVEVIEVDKALFKEKTDAVYDKFEGYQELRQQINELLGK
ncbi:C4-dicarboxylate TRAP transporter substrate-binding protein [Robertmurraya sp. DFI.2.37]|uniref:C4-dicarboxylate TRAP transporter substrate-binding protein n=1 Tax=Robertmurraya sp. DFI.2.37 TaxID=3031819 RepID=UPI001245A861|nr:C4-dicarboxylate TRAP transporter substrate-binding protein [Robertmurraya sp. DFI.2.37]MDF1511296.1 C4-dicarboxylate TRAP transporter substrate-binding protein [Robertmurraya sp. DFI.2.37]